MPPEKGRKAAAICKHLMDYNPDKPEAIWENVGHAILRLQEEIPSFQAMVCMLTTVHYIILSTEDLSLNQSKPTV